MLVVFDGCSTARTPVFRLLCADVHTRKVRASFRYQRVSSVDVCVPRSRSFPTRLSASGSAASSIDVYVDGSLSPAASILASDSRQGLHAKTRSTSWTPRLTPPCLPAAALRIFRKTSHHLLHPTVFHHFIANNRPIARSDRGNGYNLASKPYFISRSDRRRLRAGIRSSSIPGRHWGGCRY
jgi:hypothetical protein